MTIRTAAIVVFVAAFVGACGPSVSAPAASSASPALAVPSGPLASAPSSATPAATVAGATPAASSPVVDLTFSGTKAFTAKGSAGQCKLATGADGTVRFGFEATDADYPGLGRSFSLANLNGTYVDIKWVLNDSLAYGNNPSTVALSADHKSVTLKGPLAEFTPIGVAPSHPEGVTGSISCP